MNCSKLWIVSWEVNPFFFPQFYQDSKAHLSMLQHSSSSCRASHYYALMSASPSFAYTELVIWLVYYFRKKSVVLEIESLCEKHTCFKLANIGPMYCSSEDYTLIWVENADMALKFNPCIWNNWFWEKCSAPKNFNFCTLLTVCCTIATTGTISRYSWMILHDRIYHPMFCYRNAISASSVSRKTIWWWSLLKYAILER